MPLPLRTRPELLSPETARGAWMNPRVVLLLAALAAMGGLQLLLLDQTSSVDSLWGAHQTVFLECLLLAVVTLGPFAFRMMAGERTDPLEPGALFAMLYMMMFCVRPLLIESPWLNEIMSTGTEVRQFFSLSESSVAITLAYGIVGAICFHVGYRTWRNPMSERLRPVAPKPWSTRRVTHVAIGGTAFAALSLMLVLPVFSSFQTVIENLGRFRQLLAGYGYQGLGMDLLVILVLILWVDHLQSRRRWMFLPLMLASNMYNFLLGSRAGIFNLWLFMFLAWRYHHERGNRGSWKRALAIALIVVLAVVSALSIAAIRNVGVTTVGQAERALTSYWEGESNSPLSTSFMLEFDQFDIFAMVVDMGRGNFPLMWGRSYMDVLYQPIPRALWPDKPMSFDQEIGRMLTGTYTAIPPSMVGEMYMNFHIFGIIAGMLLFGYLCRRGYQRTMLRPRDPGRVLLYALLLPFLPLFMMRAFMAVATTAIIYFVPAWLAVRYIQGEKPLVWRRGEANLTRYSSSVR
jgi:oligosaccharide repeat unit polymerase